LIEHRWSPGTDDVCIAALCARQRTYFVCLSDNHQTRNGTERLIEPVASEIRACACHAGDETVSGNNTIMMGCFKCRKCVSTVALMLQRCVRLSVVVVCRLSVRDVLWLNGASYRAKVTIDSL